MLYLIVFQLNILTYYLKVHTPRNRICYMEKSPSLLPCGVWSKHCVESSHQLPFVHLLAISVLGKSLFPLPL